MLVLYIVLHRKNNNILSVSAEPGGQEYLPNYAVFTRSEQLPAFKNRTAYFGMGNEFSLVFTNFSMFLELRFVC